MAHRKSHRKGSRSTHRKGRKGSRSAHRRSHRRGRTARRTVRAQHGGASCSAQPLYNTNSFAQKGGMAPILAGDDYLIDAASRVQAQTAPLDGAFAELPSVIPRQTGGRRRSHRKGRKSHHKGSRSAHRRSASRKGRRSSRHRSSRSGRTARRTKRAQRGGALAGFNDPYMLGVDIANSGSNSQFLDYLPAKGAQAP